MRHLIRSNLQGIWCCLGEKRASVVTFSTRVHKCSKRTPTVHTDCDGRAHTGLRMGNLKGLGLGNRRENWESRKFPLLSCGIPIYGGRCPGRKLSGFSLVTMIGIPAQRPCKSNADESNSRAGRSTKSLHVTVLAGCAS